MSLHSFADSKQPLLETLAQVQAALTRHVSETSNYRTPAHRYIRPVGWHLAHTLYVESHWTRQRLLDKEIDAGLHEKIHMPGHCQHEQCGQQLPLRKQLLQLTNKVQTQTRQLLSQQLHHPLLKDNYLTLFLIQHHSMHLETLAMSAVERQLQKPQLDYQPVYPLIAKPIKRCRVTFKRKCYTLGGTDAACFDNEIPAYRRVLPTFALNRYATSNAEYLAFMQNGGYECADYWCDQGWQWLQTHQRCAPHHWRKNKRGQWFGTDVMGPYTLSADTPVHGINYFEAAAFACFCDMRLPHEHELEIGERYAQLGKVALQAAKTWQWCDTVFYPYDGFKPFPYDGYSLPWFNNQYYVLKGGSHHTHHSLRRPSYRNFYTPHKRHIFAGLRCAYRL